MFRVFFRLSRFFVTKTESCFCICETGHTAQPGPMIETHSMLLSLFLSKGYRYVCMYVCMATDTARVFMVSEILVAKPFDEITKGIYFLNINSCVCMCVCVCVFIKLHITAQSGLVILVILCHSR